MSKIISFVNQKGGVGKTTSAVNIAASLGILGYTVLIVDLDPQGNATSGVHIMKKGLKTTVYDVMMDNANPADAVIKTEFDNLWIMPTHGSLTGAEIELSTSDDGTGYYVLQKALDKIKNDYDYIIIDCPPSLGMLTINSLSASDGVVVPMLCEFYALEGLSQLTRTLERIKQHTNSKINITGILLTMYNDRTRLTKEVFEELKKHFADKLFETQISRNIKLAAAPSYGLPVYYYDKKCKGSIQYLAVAKELAARI